MSEHSVLPKVNFQTNNQYPSKGIMINYEEVELYFRGITFGQLLEEEHNLQPSIDS